jgi:RNA polymerase sigma factor (sigma-70 family)
MAVNLSDLSNRALLSRLVKAGPDDGAWLEFITRFQPRIRQLAYRAYATEASRYSGVDASRPGEVIEDLTQDVFIRLIGAERRALAAFRGLNENSFYTYLQTIALNLVRDHFKRLRAQRRPPRATSLDEPLRTTDGPAESSTLGDYLPSAAPNPEEVVETRELQSRLSSVVAKSTLGSISTRDRLIFRLYFIQGLTVDEIQEYKGIRLTKSGVEKRVRRIRAVIEKFLDEEGG